MSIVEKDKIYRDALKSESGLLRRSYDLCLDENLQLSDNEITKAILLRMREYYVAQDDVKEFLRIGQKAPAAYFFANTILFFTKLFLETLNSDLEVRSEVAIRRKRGSIKPDVSIWRNGEVTSIIECKTQLGWGRHKWESDFLARESKLQAEFPEAKAFLLVLTKVNWPGFGDSAEIGKKYHILTNIWPSNIHEDQFDEIIENPFERILEQIVI